MPWHVSSPLTHAERKSTGPVAEVPEAANEQHYELPPEFLGNRWLVSHYVFEPR